MAIDGPEVPRTFEQIKERTGLSDEGLLAAANEAFSDDSAAADQALQDGDVISFQQLQANDAS